MRRKIWLQKDEVSRSRIESLPRCAGKLEIIHRTIGVCMLHERPRAMAWRANKTNKDNFAYGMTPFLTWYEISKSWPQRSRVVSLDLRLDRFHSIYR